MQIDKKVENEVADYYNNNTARFLRFKRRKTSGSIHRRLYPALENKKVEPEHYSDSLVLNLIEESNADRILDLGCGVGSSIRYLESKHKANYTGITLSPEQCKIAENFGTGIELGSYLDAQWYKGRNKYDVIYAIESLQHNPNHNLLAENLKKVMKNESYLVVIDDFMNSSLKNNQVKLVDRFKKHWHSHGYTSVDEFISILQTGGLSLYEKKELTHLMKRPILSRALRAAYLSVLSLLPLNNSSLDNIIGGGTLILLQQLKISGYYKLVFRIN